MVKPPPVRLPRTSRHCLRFYPMKASTLIPEFHIIWYKKALNKSNRPDDARGRRRLLVDVGSLAKSKMQKIHLRSRVYHSDKCLINACVSVAQLELRFCRPCSQNKWRKMTQQFTSGTPARMKLTQKRSKTSGCQTRTPAHDPPGWGTTMCPPQSP